MAGKTMAPKAPKQCPTGQHRMPDGKCMKDSSPAMKRGTNPGSVPMKRSSGY